jgi:hypothetical protein
MDIPDLILCVFLTLLSEIPWLFASESLLVDITQPNQAGKAGAAQPDGNSVMPDRDG